VLEPRHNRQAAHTEPELEQGLELEQLAAADLKQRIHLNRKRHSHICSEKVTASRALL
jgi:hypothetical protein